METYYGYQKQNLKQDIQAIKNWSITRSTIEWTLEN